MLVPRSVGFKVFGLKVMAQDFLARWATLLGANMETPKGPHKDYSPSNMGLHGFSMLATKTISLTHTD